MCYKENITALLFEGYSCPILVFKTYALPETVTGVLSSVTVFVTVIFKWFYKIHCIISH